jgi:glycosyltransferase involved in cell wall biosynthesis
MFERIKYNLDFKRHCRMLKNLPDKPFLSFVIPTRNEAQNLLKLLLSLRYILDVCEVAGEIIVVDYMSTDGTPNIAKSMGAEVISVSKPGVGYASYIGVLNARGDIIVRTDADVIMTPSAIYHTVKILNERSTKIVATVGHIYYPLDIATNLIAYLYDKYIRKPYNTTGYFIAFKGSLAKQINFNPELKANDDWDFGLRAYKILGVGKLYYHYYPAVLVNSRLVRKKGLSRYIFEGLGIMSSMPIPYSQL